MSNSIIAPSPGFLEGITRIKIAEMQVIELDRFIRGDICYSTFIDRVISLGIRTGSSELASGMLKDILETMEGYDPHQIYEFFTDPDGVLSGLEDSTTDDEWDELYDLCDRIGVEI